MLSGYFFLMIHKAFNKAEIAERYYKKLGKFSTRAQAVKNFNLLRHPDKGVLLAIFKEVMAEQKQNLK